MQAFYATEFVLPLPAGHRFPMAKYAMLRDAVKAHLPGVQLYQAHAASDGELALAHTPRYIRAVMDGQLSAAEIREIGFPWSPGMGERARRSVGATIQACRTALFEGEGVAANLAGGTHHAYADKGSGFCVFNDAAVAARVLQAEGLVGRVIVIDPGHNVGNERHVSQINRHYWVGLDKICNTTGTSTRSGYPEATYTYDVAQRLARLLTAQGATVVLTRDHNSRAQYGPCIQARGLRATDALGRTMGDVVWMSDVTEGVAAVDTLTQERHALMRECDLLKAALDGLADPVWLRDDDLSLIYCNAAYVKAVDANATPLTFTDLMAL